MKKFSDKGQEDEMMVKTVPISRKCRKDFR